MVLSSFKLTIVAIVGPRILHAEEEILEHVEEENHIITRRLAAEVGVSQFVVRTMDKRTRPHPYHVQKVQGCEPVDCPRCVIYSKLLLAQCRERPNFLKCILFTDESGFKRNAVFNSDNTHFFSDETPHARQQVRFEATVFDKSVSVG